MVIYRKKTITIDVYEKIEDESVKHEFSIDEAFIEPIEHHINEIQYDHNVTYLYSLKEDENYTCVNKEEYFEYIFNKYYDSLIEPEEILNDSEFEEYLEKYFDKKYSNLTETYYYILKQEYSGEYNGYN